MRILIMGLPGSGKTTFADALGNHILNNGKTVLRLNADEIRSKFNDWDFSYEGRIRQAFRMKELTLNSNVDFIICDFVAPTDIIRDIFDADLMIWIDTISISRYDDTNKVFEIPHKYDMHICNFNYSIDEVYSIIMKYK